MKNISLIVASLSLVIAGSAFAQNATNGVTTSTDPAKAAAVERHANELKNNPQPVASEIPAKHVMRHHMKKHHMKSHSKRNHPKAMAAK